MKNFWKSLPDGFLVLAPMEGVTDTVFRRVMVRAGRPEVMFTEFTGMEQLFSPGYLATSQNFEYEEVERPLVAQIWGYTPELFAAAGELVVKLGFDGVDINMGCPDRSVTKRMGGSALVRDRELAVSLVRELKRGVAGEIPVSVKIRLGWKDNLIEEWARTLLAEEIAALSVHGRTTKELSRVPADWESIGRAVKVRDEMGVNTLIIGNGDVVSREDAAEKVEQFGVDGVMIGRGVFSNPWIFAKDSQRQRSKQERLDLLLYHLELWEETWGEAKKFERLKRFFKIYVADFEGAVELRSELMEMSSIEEVRVIVHKELE